VTQVEAIHGVSLVVKKGESVGLLGANGAGKTTLLRAIGGMIPAASGAVYAASQPAFLSVNAALLPALTGEENIIIGGLALGLSYKEIRAKVDDIANLSGIGDFVHLPMSTYSSGMGARLRFAISTAARPDILLVDEALATGDAEFRQRSADILKEIRDSAGTLFLVSHSSSSIRENCTRCLWLDHGHIVADGDPDEVCDAYEDYAQILATMRRQADGAAKGSEDDDQRPPHSLRQGGRPGSLVLRLGGFDHPERRYTLRLVRGKNNVVDKQGPSRQLQWEWRDLEPGAYWIRVYPVGDHAPKLEPYDTDAAIVLGEEA
jgi:teichoic acid transport system ATP-binding protein